MLPPTQCSRTVTRSLALSTVTSTWSSSRRAIRTRSPAVVVAAAKRPPRAPHPPVPLQRAPLPFDPFAGPQAGFEGGGLDRREDLPRHQLVQARPRQALAEWPRVIGRRPTADVPVPVGPPPVM